MTSRRRFLAAAGATALLPACPLNIVPMPADSPLRRGPFAVGRAILGITPETSRLAVPEDVHFTPWPTTCAGTPEFRPETIQSDVYYPAVAPEDDVHLSIRSRLASGAFPLVLFAHGRRIVPYCPVPAGIDPSAGNTRWDFLKWGHLCSHIASHGFVVVVPDLGWLGFTLEDGSLDSNGGDRPARAAILADLHLQLANRNAVWFADQLAHQNLTLLGHSTGATACLIARPRLADTKLVASIGPAVSQVNMPLAAGSPATLAIGGTLDEGQGANPQALFTAAARPKALVMLTGATHWGYSSLCTVDNQTCPHTGLPGPAGTISRTVQAEVAAGFIVAAAKRFAKGDMTMQPFLDGTTPTGADSYLPVQITAELS